MTYSGDAATYALINYDIDEVKSECRRSIVGLVRRELHCTAKNGTSFVCNNATYHHVVATSAYLRSLPGYHRNLTGALLSFGYAGQFQVILIGVAQSVKC